MSSIRCARSLLLLAACAGVACTQPPVGPDSSAEVRGTATYHERMALPPNAVFEAVLEDVSKADAAAEVIGRARIEGPGNPPFAFVIAYDPARINPRNRYSVRARVLVGDKLMFATHWGHPVLTGGQGSSVALVMRRASGQGQASDEPLENTYWKLTHLGDTIVVLAEKQREPHFVLHTDKRRLSGSGGCNRLFGSYRLEGHRLSFGGMASTMMACPQGMDTEKAYLAALARAAAARVAGQRLELLDAAGAVVARFEAVHFK